MKCIASLIVSCLVVINANAKSAEAIAYAALKEGLLQHYTEVEIKPMHVPHYTLSPPYTVHLPALLHPGKQVKVDVSNSKGSYPVWFYVKVYKEALVAKTNLPKGSLDSLHVEKKRIDVSGKPQTLDVLPERAYLKRSIPKAHPIYARDLQTAPIVLPGDRVMAQAVSNQIVLRFEAIVQQAGNSNEVILIRQHKSQNTYKARVINAHEVVLV